MMFTVNADTSCHRIDFKVMGTLTEEEGEALASAIRAAVAKLKLGQPSFTLLADMQDGAVQSQTVATMGAATIEWCGANGMTRSAAVVGSAVGKLQTARINHQDGNRVFQSREEAISWLDS